MSEIRLTALARVVRESTLVPPGTRGIVLLSGGPDSAATVAGLVGFLQAADVSALHLNYRLRTDSEEDEAMSRELCRRLGVELLVEHPTLEEGNLQAAAREARYAAAERLRQGREADWVATGHTRTDLAETLIYRLATSPGSRGLLGLQPRRGNVVRPLLALERAEVRTLAQEAGLPFRDDPTNLQPQFARNRIRREVLPVLREIGPAAERVIAETQAQLGEEAEALEQLAAEALRRAGAGSGPVVSVEALEGLQPALRRIALRSLAERVFGGTVALGRERAGEIWRLAHQPEGGVVELGGGLEARLEHGHVRFALGESALAEAAVLSLPGSCRFGGWEVTADLVSGPVEVISPDTAVLDPETLSRRLLVRAWREGDRMQPLGLQGTKSLQDLFTDRKVPRSLRRTLPIVTSGGRIAWIAGVAVSQEFAAGPGAERAAVLSAAVIGSSGLD